MELHILLAGVEFGPYTDDKARQLLGDGFLSATDPAKRLDGTDWQPLSAVLGEVSAPAVTADLPEAEPEFVPAAPAEDEPPTEPASAVAEEEPEPPPPAAPPAMEDEPAPVAMKAAEPIAPERPAPPAPAAPNPPPAVARTTPASPVSAAPKLQVSVPSRAKKGAQATRTGSLMMKEALQAAQGGRSALTPAGPIKSTTTAPVPELVPEPAPPRRRAPVKLGEQPEAPAAPPPPRKTIKLSGRVGLPGTAPQPDKSAAAPATKTASRPSTAPKLPAQELAKFSGFIARPSDIAKKETAPPRESGSLSLRERRDTGVVKPPARKTIKLTGPISLPGRLTGPTPPARAPQTEDDDGPMVMARTSRAPRITPPEPPAEPEEKAPDETTASAPSEPLAVSIPSAAPVETAGTPLEHPAEKAAAAALAAEIAAPEGLSAGDSLSASGPVSAELAARRSLKITGSLRHPPAPASGPIRLGSPSGESGPLVPVTETPVGPAAGLEPAAPWPSPPVPEEDLPDRPPTGKISVDQMPTEGVKVRTTRRLTSKVPIPASPAESLAYESPARANPPPLPRSRIELPPAPVFTARSAPTPPAVPAVPEPVTPPAPSVEQAAPPLMEVPAAAPALQTEPEPLAGPGDATAAPAEMLAKPEKVRLRRPVNLDLSSRAKPQDSGRITLETFSKLAAVGESESVPGVAMDEMTAPVATVAPPPTVDKAESPVPPAEAAAPAAAPSPEKAPLNSAVPLSFPKRLEEAPAVSWTDSGKSAGEPPLVWLLYSIIAVGAVALCVIVYLWVHRAPSETPEEATTPATASVPASAAPPTSAAPPASVAPPSTSTPAPALTTANPPATSNAAPPPSPQPVPPAPSGSSAPDVQHQAAAFVSDGILKYQRNDLDGAIAAYNQALDLDPKSAEAYYNRGIAKAAHDDLDGAIADYSQALQVKPNLASAYYYRGLARHSKAELDGAITDYNQAVQLDPKNALAFFNRGLIRMQKDDIDGAIVDSSRAIELDPHLIQSYYDRGLGRLAKGAMDAAMDDMRTFCQQAPQDAYTDYARLYIWLIQTRDGQLADANADLGKAMNSGWNGTPDSMVTRLGEYLLGQISESELIKASASAVPVKDQGQRCEAWYFIGMRKLVEGDKDAAVAALQKCVATQKTDYCEYILAQEQLRTLSGAASTDANPPPPRATPVTLPDPGTITPANPTTP